MFLEHYPNCGKDITFCTAKECKATNCARHPKHYPKRPGCISVSDFAPVCRTYICGVLNEVERRMTNEID